MNYRYWTEEEDEFLIESYPRYGSRYCSNKLGRGINNITSRRQILKIQTNSRKKIFRPLENSKIQILISWEKFDRLKEYDLIPFECIGCCEIKYKKKSQIYTAINYKQEHIFCSRECCNIINLAKEYAGLSPSKFGKTHKSIPCEKLKQDLRDKNIEFKEEIKVLKHLGRFYSTDIVFERYGVIVEINGKQHYNHNGNLKPYYQERHNLLTENKWKVLEIPSYYVYKQGFMDDLLKLIQDSKSSPNFEYKRYENICKCGNKIKGWKAKQCDKCYHKNKVIVCPLTREELHWYMWNLSREEFMLHLDVSAGLAFRWIKKANFNDIPVRGYRKGYNNGTIIDYQI